MVGFLALQSIRRGCDTWHAVSYLMPNNVHQEFKRAVIVSPQSHLIIHHSNSIIFTKLTPWLSLSSTVRASRSRQRWPVKTSVLVTWMTPVPSLELYTSIPASWAKSRAERCAVGFGGVVATGCLGLIDGLRHRAEVDLRWVEGLLSFADFWSWCKDALGWWFDGRLVSLLVRGCSCVWCVALL
jgi:hypothetical protein